MTLFIGDVRDGLRTFAPGSVQTCVTSPPYFGLRDYGVAGQIGLEPTIAEYVANMVDVFRLVRDVLADDGTLWLNLGDSYAAGGIGRRDDDTMPRPKGGHGDGAQPGYYFARPLASGLKPKDLCGIPWRVAFALQADGWWLRSDIIWAKPNPMPESVTDRPTKSHEYLFLLAKSERYYYDYAAILESFIESSGGWQSRQSKGLFQHGAKSLDAQGKQGFGGVGRGIETGRNKRSVWTVATQPYADAHFATFPPKLIEPCIMAGTSERGHCPACGKGWERITERDKSFESGSGRSGNAIKGKQDLCALPTNSTPDIRLGPTISTRTTGWQPGCDCGLDPVPGVVLDPFMGSGTIAQVAQDLGRRWLGCELNPDYAKMIERRTAQMGMAFA